MSKAVRVDTADLHVSAATVDAHADDVQLRHTTADFQIESARAGVPGGSAAALSSAVAKWQGDSAALYQRMIDHSQSLRLGAASYEQTDVRSAADVAEAADQIIDLGL